MATKDWKQLERHMTPDQIALSDERYDSLRLGIHIKQMRDKFGLTQQELAERLGVSQARISQWESGEDVKLVTLEKVASTLGVRIELIGRTADQETVFSSVTN